MECVLAFMLVHREARIACVGCYIEVRRAAIGVVRVSQRVRDSRLYAYRDGKASVVCRYGSQHT